MPSTFGAVVIADAILASSSGVADSPISKPFISTASTMAMVHSNRPMASELDRV